MSFTMNICLASVLITGCAVEAGNPTGKKPKGNATVSFMKTTSTGGNELSISLESISLISSDGNASALQTLSLSNQDVTLLNGDSAAPNADAAQADVDTGTYSGIIIRLPERRPPRYKSPDGTKSDLATDNLDQQGFRIDQAIEIKEGETTNVLIRIDPIGSLIKDPDKVGQFKFDPRGDAFPHPPQAKYNGTTDLTDAVYVCAYGYGLSKPPQPPKDDAHPIPPPPPPPPGASFGARHHNSFATRAAIAFDATSKCANAFTKTDVKNQAYVLDHVPPGTYALRFFKADDTFVDQPTDITVNASNLR